ILHQVRILGRVFVIGPQYGHGAKAGHLKEELGGQIRLANFQRDPHPPLARQFAEQLLDHLPADAAATEFRGNRKVEDVEPRLMELVDHEPDDALAALGDHANAVALPQAADEVFFEPGKFKAAALDVEHLRHVAADHPTNVDADLLLRIGAHRGL